MLRMSRIHLVLMFMVTYYSSIETAPPPPFKDYSYSEVTKSYYRCYDNAVNYNDAIKRCKRDKAELGVPKTKLEFDTLKGNFNRGVASIWLALTDQDKEGQFKTPSGLLVDEIYTNWEVGEPNDGGTAANEDCTEMLYDGRYNDIKCEEMRAFICVKALISTENENEVSSSPTSEVDAKNETSTEIIPLDTDRIVTPVRQPNSFRRDYVYDAETGYYYKPHLISKNFSTAVSVCKSEGSQMAVPKNKLEVTVLNKQAYAKYPATTEGHWVGIHDILTEGDFLTLDGVPVSESYVNWKPQFPDTFRDDRDCVVIDKEGFYYDTLCANTFPFTCTKHESTINNNFLCDTYDPAYFYKQETDRCYKLHTSSSTWNNAFRVCRAEVANLAEINSATEAKILSEEFSKQRHGNFNKTFFHVDFSDILIPETFTTSKYQTLTEAGYEEWEEGEPDNRDGNEHCGGMLVNGKLADVNCNTRALFFCEKSLPKLEIEILQRGSFDEES